MKTSIIKIFSAFILFCLAGCGQQNTFQRFTPVPFTRVTIDDQFWSRKIDTNRINGIPGCFAACNYSLVNFDIAAGSSSDTREGTLASDSDVYKIIQGVAHALDHHKDPGLESFTDSLIDRIALAQEPDGYLDTYFTILKPADKWINVEQNHELYCAGHLFEAASDYYRVTGKRKLLDVAIRLADHIDRKFGRGKLEEVSGHEEIELALISLYEVTGEKRYLDLAAWFIEERGNPERLARKELPMENDPNKNTPARYRKPEYRQDHLPVADQTVAVGHAVRAAYLYCGMADLERITGSSAYIAALESISNDVVTKKIYVTGATGTSVYHDEGFGSGSSLKNKEAYCETCSSIALMLWNYRMNALTGDSKYADLFELTLYNGGISGVSLSGNRFFYVNPLVATGNEDRDTWFEPGCCPSNMVRFIPQMDQFIYGQRNNSLYVNQFVGSEANIELPAGTVKIKQTTGYLVDGNVNVRVNVAKKTSFSLLIRIPAWVRGQFFPGDLYFYSDNNRVAMDRYPVTVNGKAQNSIIRPDGYIEINRRWSDGDQVHLEFDMPVKLVAGNSNIEDVAGQRVITRGPMVYCLEATDNPELFAEPGKFIMDTLPVKVQFQPDFLGGINVIAGYARDAGGEDTVDFFAIPYYTWCNRGPGAMKVWFSY